MLSHFSVNDLRDRIAGAIAGEVKSYDVPTVCVKVGIQNTVDAGDASEANSSKRVYVKKRILVLDKAPLLQIAKKILEEYSAPALAEIVTEMSSDPTARVSPLVRSDVLKALNSFDNLFGDGDAIAGLIEIFGEAQIRRIDIRHGRLSSLEDLIVQHYLRNSDWSNEELLTECGALTCSQTAFFTLLEKILHPMVRRDGEQTAMAEAINLRLKRDAFLVRTTSAQSGYPIYGVVRASDGVVGTMKNLIFASIGEKPELIFRDAVNNNVEIVRHADKVLIYERPLPLSGVLLWKDLQSWWQEKNSVGDPEEAKRQLYRWLLQAVQKSGSPGEFAIFKGYYTKYGAKLEERLPALLPQVYLHYDPYTKRERGDEKFLTRQRMDFLVMPERNVRVVIEVDGRQHYGSLDGPGGATYVANAPLYAGMVAEDRRLRLAGYEVYRFGGAEFPDVDVTAGVVGPKAQTVVDDFFARLFKKHGVV
jgi:hypothetical protein